MIPWEAFPEYFNGSPVKEQWQEISRRVRSYFSRHGGLESAHRPGGILRVAYSLNENTGLVSLPIPPGGLDDFRPWEASIYCVKADRPWFGDGILEDAKSNTERFLEEAFADTESKGASIPISGLKIRAKDTAMYSGESASPPYLKKQIQLLDHESAATRAQAAWNLMVSDADIPMEVFTAGAEDDNATVRWFLTEAIQRKLGEKSPS